VGVVSTRIVANLNTYLTVDSEVEIKFPVEGLMNAVYASIGREMYDAIKEAGENPDDYHLTTYPGVPINIERRDGKRIGRHVLLAIKKRLTAD
jgi:hypothetical protein